MMKNFYIISFWLMRIWKFSAFFGFHYYNAFLSMIASSVSWYIHRGWCLICLRPASVELLKQFRAGCISRHRLNSTNNALAQSARSSKGFQSWMMPTMLEQNIPSSARWSWPKEIQRKLWLWLGWVWWAETDMVFFLLRAKSSMSEKQLTSRYLS